MHSKPVPSLFLSWSGPRSEAIAVVLKQTLRAALDLNVFLSSQDMAVGLGWFEQIEHALADSTVGLLCLTQEALASPWVSFEAGVISALIGKKRVIPLLFDCDPKGSPIASLQCLPWNSTNGCRRLLLEVQQVTRARPRAPASTLRQRCAKADRRIARILIAPPLAKELADMPEGFQRRLGQSIYTFAGKAVARLHQDATYQSEIQYVTKLQNLIRDMGPGDSLCAICGHKNWRLHGWKHYMDLNLMAAERKASVRRLYIEPASGHFTPEENRMIRKQLSATDRLRPHFAAGVVLGNAAKRFRQRYDFADSYGLVIVGRMSTPLLQRPRQTPLRSDRKQEPPSSRREYNVMLHHGLGETDRRGYLFEDRYIASAAREMFDEAWQYILPHREASSRFDDP